MKRVVVELIKKGGTRLSEHGDYDTYTPARKEDGGRGNLLVAKDHTRLRVKKTPWMPAGTTPLMTAKTLYRRVKKMRSEYAGQN